MAVYLPVNYLGSLNFDDAELVARLHKNFPDINWYGLFFRTSSTKYYRPLLEVLCYMDYAAWGLSINAYHFSNYSIHILNTALVYLIALRWFRPDRHAAAWASLAMVLFALNPMSCESVAWISGRSDLAGTFFCLLAVYCYFLKRPIRYVLTPFFILLGLLCKENALAAIPIIVLLELYINHKKNKQFKDNLKKCCIWSIIVLLPLVVYLFLRTNGWEHYTYKYIEVLTPSTSTTQPAAVKQAISKIFIIFPVIAFYLKKLVMPFPLNFAISDINLFFYSLLFGFCFIAACFLCIKKKGAIIFFITLLVISFVPALPVALGGVAWSPMAERYLYMSTSIMGIGVACYFMSCHKKQTLRPRVLLLICFLLVLVLSISTLKREFVFDTNKSLWADTLKKNPDNQLVLFKYAQTYGGQEGQKIYHKAAFGTKRFPWRDKAFIEMAKYEGEMGNNQKAVDYVEQALAIRNNRRNYSSAAHILLSMTEEDHVIKTKYVKKAIGYYKEMYRRKKTLFVLYQIASLLNHVKEEEEANKLFLEIIKKYPNSKYAGYAKKQLN